MVRAIKTLVLVGNTFCLNCWRPGSGVMQVDVKTIPIPASTAIKDAQLRNYNSSYTVCSDK